MGEVIEINEHLDVEVRRESFIIHDDELSEGPEFGFNRVYPMKAAVEAVIAHPRFQRWLAKQEGRHYEPPRSQWQPIATAPMDGTRFLAGTRHKIYGWLWAGCRRITTDKYHPGGYWHMEGGGEPTHWLPLPPTEPQP